MDKEQKRQLKSRNREEKKKAKLAKKQAEQSLRAEKVILREVAKQEKLVKKEEETLKNEKKIIKQEAKVIKQEAKSIKQEEKAKANAEKEEIKRELAKSNKKVFDWYKLDNAAKIFPAVSSVKDTNVFRLGVRMKSQIDPEILQSALVQTLERFPAFRVKLKRGVFWYFFEFNEKKPIVFEDDDCPCALIVPENLNDYLFKTSYFQNRIYIDVFHSLSDGGGAIEFLKTLTLCYLQMSGENVETGGLVKNPYAKSSLSEHENSYVKYYDKHDKKVDMPPKAYKMTGTQYEYGFSVINAHTSASEFLKLAKSKNCTITQYVVTTLLLAVYNIDFKGNPHNFNLPIQVLVPVNLRKMFPSETLRNFSSIVHGALQNGDNVDFDSVLNGVKESFEKSLTPDFMKTRFSSHTQIEKNLAIRIAPRVVKDIIMKAVYETSGTANITTNFSNLGVVKLPESMEKFVSGFEFQSSVSKRGVTFCSAVTYRDDLCISFTRRIKEARLEKEFFRMLQKDGLEFCLEENEIWSR
ncbi:MAG: hypothetical protein R3Y65_08420 [Bacillota bacterium]